METGRDWRPWRHVDQTVMSTYKALAVDGKLVHVFDFVSLQTVRCAHLSAKFGADGGVLYCLYFPNKITA